MKIEYRTGNLFDEPNLTHLVHCCNAQGVMGSGFAKELRQRHPSVYDTYHLAYQESRKVGQSLPMGWVVDVNTPTGIMVYNLIGQEFFGGDGKKYVSYDAIADGMMWIDENITLGAELCMPTMGAVLAGGKWSVIASIVEAYSTRFKPVVYLFDGKMPDG